MPLGPKLVLAIQMIGLAFGVFWAFTLMRVGDTIGIVIQSAILIGLYTRQTIAWMTARWLTGIGAVLLSFAVVISVPSLFAQEHGTKLWVWGVLGFEAGLAWSFFCLLGRSDSRAYFNAPRKKPNQAMERTADRSGSTF
jgi:hypothetical protein